MDKRTATRIAAGVGAVVIAAVMLGPSLLRTPPQASPTGPIAIASPTAAPTATIGPSATPDPWSDLALEPFEPQAELTALDPDRLGFASGSTWQLRSLTGAPAAELAEGLRTDPPLELAVKAGASSDMATIRVTGQPDPGTRYRFRLSQLDGSLAGTWVFRARAPLHVVTMLPGNRSTGVPPNTGIEVTFDQDGTVGLPQHFSIEPEVKGRFEQHGRTWSFVPDAPLTPAVIYTVKVGAGVAIAGSVETLEDEVTFQFETGSPADREPSLQFGRQIVEVRPNAEPAISVWFDEDDEEDRPRIPRSVFVLVHRLPTFRAVTDAAERLAGRDGWAIAAPSAVVDTSKLTSVARVEANLRESDFGWVFEIPVRLDGGFYILTIEQDGAPAQALLQVTNLSAYALTASHDMAVWVNDLRTGAPTAGADLAVVGGPAVGTTNANGLFHGPTPSMLLDPNGEAAAGDTERFVRPAARFLSVHAVDGRRLLVPLGLPMSSGYFEEDGWWSGNPANQDYWVAFFSDRDAYRQTDVVHLSGMVRARSDRSIPEGLEVRLSPYGSSADAPIAHVAIEPSKRGVFVADLRLDALPRADYGIDLFAGDVRIASLWIRVTEIRKPAYRIAVTTDRQVYFVGEDVHVSATATFFDGSPVPGMDLQFQGSGQQATAATGAAGEARATLTARYEDRPEGIGYDSLGVMPAHPEEGQISGDQWLLVLPSTSWLEATGTLANGQIVVTGTLSRADRDKLEAAIRSGEDMNPAGAPIGRGSVKAIVVHEIPVREKVGTSYDFIEKRVVPVYEYSTRHERIATLTLTTAADGTFRLSVPAPVAGDSYSISLTTVDPQGRTFVRDVSAFARTWNEPNYTGLPYLEALGGCGSNGTVQARIDELVDVTMHDADGSVVDTGSLLFLVTSRGSMETTVQDAATFARSLRDEDLPGFTVRAVWLNDRGYSVSDVDVAVDPDEKAITVTLQPDKARYRPGGTVTLDITTTDAGGHPIAADVVVQGVDEKLYALGFASSLDPISALLAPTSPGYLNAYRSHEVPAEGWGGGCGDTGGGDRADFRDSVTFQRVATDANGHGVATFDLADDLTSWRMTATAYSGHLDAGVGTVQIPVSLPFFGEAVLAPEYLVGDVPVLLVRGYGAALGAGDRVRFTVSSRSLGLEPTTVQAAAFQAARIPLPTMTAGDHRIRIEAEVGIGGEVRRDVLIRTIHVVGSRLAGSSSTFVALGPGWSPTGGDGLTRFVITDVGRGRLLELLDRLTWAQSSRFDRTLAAELARTILVQDYRVPESWMSSTGFDAGRFQSGGGISLLPYSSGDLELSAMTALVAPQMVDVGELRQALTEWESIEGTPLTRERTIVALAGRAALGDDVSEALLGYDEAPLTVSERLWVALGIAATGDETAARAIERDLLSDFGQRLGPWVRLLAPDAVTSESTSALLLLLSARLGDPIAPDIARYLLDNPSRERVFPLEELGYVQAVLERLPRDPARLAWTVDGERHEQRLPRGGSFTLLLTRSQWTGLKLEPLTGELGVATSFDSPDVDLPASEGLSIVRTVTPGNSASADQLVRVQIHVTFSGQLPKSCYRLTDLAPSGLTPVSATLGWEEWSDEINTPWDVDGQRVAWCASPDDPFKTYTYTARVVTPGAYRWEPAVLQWEEGPELGTSIPESSYVIR